MAGRVSRGIGTFVSSRAAVYRIDPYNLGVFRVLLGTALLIQIFVYLLPARHLSFYPDAAIDPVNLKRMAGPLTYSLLDIFQSRPAVNAFFGSAIALCILLVLGYRSRIVSMLLLFVLWNIHQRGVFASGTESNYAMVLLTPACFLPLNSAFVPGRFRQEHRYPQLLYDLLCAAILIQVGWIYFATGLFKVDPAWFDGTALRHIFGLDPLNAYAVWHNRPFGWTAPLCYIIPATEISMGAAILLYPRDKGWFRLFLGLGIAGLHLGIVVFLNLWQFTFYALAAASLLVPFRKLLPALPDRAAFSFRAPAVKIGLRESLVIFYILLICVINVRMLTLRSMVSPALHKLKISRAVHMISPPKVDYASFLNQHWSLYGYIPRPFSCVSFTGYGEDGKLYDLIAGTERGGQCCFRNSLAEKEHLELIRILYFHAAYELIYPEMIRGYYDHWQRLHPDLPLSGLEARRYYYRDGETAYDVVYEFREGVGQ